MNELLERHECCICTRRHDVRDGLYSASGAMAPDEVFGRYAVERLPGERFGDFTIRAGIVQEVAGSGIPLPSPSNCSAVPEQM